MTSNAKQKQNQKGGFLEPVQAVPKFHYTESPARKAWTKMVYPYAPYFFNMFREIPWNEWKYEDDELVAKCNSKTPYVIIGGAACELLDKVYGPQLPMRGRLHTHTDPTGDIDVLMPGILIRPHVAPEGKKRSHEYTYFSDHKGTMMPYTRSYVNWLLDQIEAYFKKIAYNFAEWFPTATDFIYAANEEAAYAEPSTARTVGPFRIYLSIFPKPKGEEAHMKIQVSMAHEYEGITDQEHFIELLLSWDSPQLEEVAWPHIKLETLGLIVCRAEGELNRNQDGIQNRVKFIEEADVSHKVKNHFGRAIFLINLLNLPRFYDSLTESMRKIVPYIYRNGITKAAEQEAAKEYVIKMMKLCPRRFKEMDPIYTTYRQVCEDYYNLTLETCGLPAEASNPKPNPKSNQKGGRHTRRLRKLFHRE